MPVCDVQLTSQNIQLCDCHKLSIMVDEKSKAGDGRFDTTWKNYLYTCYQVGLRGPERSQVSSEPAL